MTLTETEILEYSKTIALACGWKPDEYQLNGICVPGVKITRTTVACEIGPFNPFADWNDAMRAADALGVVAFSVFPHTPDGKWVAEVETSIHVIPETHPDRLTAFFLALYEIAKAKLEEE